MPTAPAASSAALVAEARERFRANCEALAVHQPEVAAAITRTPLPDGASIVTGRDSAPVVLSTADASHADWLGGTSMPTVSAPEVLRGAQDPALSVALASVGSGYEAPLLAERLAPYAAVFVCAADIRKLAAALHAADWSNALRRGQIVVLTGPTEAALVDFLEKNPGYQVPARVQALPDVPSADFAELAAAIQRGAQRADAAQQQTVARLTEQVARRRVRTSRTRPRVLVLSTDAVGGGSTFAAEVEAALAAQGFAPARCVPDAPQRCHRIARLAALRDHEPDWVLLINCTPGGLREAWPADLPFACWFLESSTLPANALAGLAELESPNCVLAASTPVADLLRARGAREVGVLEPGVNDAVFRPLRRDDVAGAAGCTIAVVQDGCDLTPAASNIGLESHERLWTAAADLLTRDLRGGRKSLPSGGAAGADLLGRAERATGVTLSDPKLRGEFATLLAARVIATVTAREVVTALQPAGEVGLWGAGWESYAQFDAARRGPIPGADERNRIYQEAAVVVFPHFGPASVRGVYEVLAAGGCPVLFQPPADAGELYPEGGQILADVPAASDLAALLKAVRRLAGDTACRKTAVARARATLMAGLTLRQRVAWLHEKLTAGGAS
ncbi:MAG: glycosyltransferase family 1 protein [Phycisphaerales bacterium]|nr:glycosyltransferase family 1 protein [Phycisphaerales bacterium]